jgi:hypothetical protein
LKNKPGKRRWFVHGNGSSLGIRDSEMSDGCLPSKIADVTFECEPDCPAES